MRDEFARLIFAKAFDVERIDPARTFHTHRIPDQPAVMRDLGDMGHGQVFFLPRPRRQPESDMARGNAVLVGGDARREQE